MRQEQRPIVFSANKSLCGQNALHVASRESIRLLLAITIHILSFETLQLMKIPASPLLVCSGTIGQQLPLTLYRITPKEQQEYQLIVFNVIAICPHYLHRRTSVSCSPERYSTWKRIQHSHQRSYGINPKRNISFIIVHIDGFVSCTRSHRCYSINAIHCLH